MRARSVALLALLLGLGLSGMACAKEKAQERQRFTVHAPVQAVDAALVRALDFLEGQQQAEGFWQNNSRTLRVETTTWAVLAFLANGHTPQAGPYRRTVEKGLAWLAKNASAIKLTQYRERTSIQYIQPNAIQGQVLFVLLCAIGMDNEMAGSEDLVILCERGIEEVLRNQLQKQEGGKVNALDTDFAAGGFGRVEESYWLTLCLLAARQTGIRVPDLALNGALQFWKRHYQAQHGAFFDQLEGPQCFGDVAKNYGVIFSSPCMILLALLGDAQGREAQGGLEPLGKLDLTDREWWWNFGGEHYEPFAPSPAAKFSREERNRMQSLERFQGERYLALKLCGIPAERVDQERELFSSILLANQTENGAFRFAGWEFEWPAHMKYGTSAFVTLQGYGDGWNETMITAHAAYALALPKAYLPAFNVWEKQP